MNLPDKYKDKIHESTHLPYSNVETTNVVSFIKCY